MDRSRTMRGLALAVALWAAGCSVPGEPVAPVMDVPVVLQPALIPSAADGDALPINRIRAVAIRNVDQSLIDETTTDVDPTADEWTVEFAVGTGGPVIAVVYLYLIHVTAGGTELVQFSGRTDPLSLTPGEPLEPDVTLVRGPLSNLDVTDVQISGAPTTLLVGETATITATATSTSGTATVFLTSTEPTVVGVDGASATALALGSARVIASAGALADTVTIDVLPPDTVPPVVEATMPADGALGVPNATLVEVLFSEDIDPTSVNAASFTLTDSLGAMVPATVTVQGAVVTLEPTTPLDTVASYTASLAAGVADLGGNVAAAGVTWTFSTAAGASLISTFDTGRGTLVAIARETPSGNLYVLDDFNAWISIFTPDGQITTDSLPAPGPSSNDIDIDVLTVPSTLGSTPLPTGTLIVNNGEVAPGVLYGVDPTTGVALDSLPIVSANNPVGGAHHPIRGTYFSVRWNADLIDEIDLTTGEVLTSWPVTPAGAPVWDVFFGDVDVHPVTGNLYIVSSTQNSMRVMTPDGAWVQDIDFSPLGVIGMSGIALEPETSSAWLSSTNGSVYHVAGVR